jgi:glutamate-5-semialdehyde dehydrogenase
MLGWPWGNLHLSALELVLCQNKAMNPSIAHIIDDIGQKARFASALMAKASAQQKSVALKHLAQLLRTHEASLLQANALDLKQAKEKGLEGPLYDRLKLTHDILATCAAGCEQLALAPDIIGEVLGLKEQPSGIRVGQMRVPIGVFAMIFESRPNVTIEAASLSIKSANACLLRGGSEAFESNQALTALVQKALEMSGLPPFAVQAVPTTDREAVGHLIQSPQWVDVVIPRGGKGLIERITKEAKVPVIKHLDGNCHTYVDATCDIDMAIKVVENAKTQKYSPCNALESLLVHERVAQHFLPPMASCLAKHGVEMRCCANALKLLGHAISQGEMDAHHHDLIKPAVESDWFEEYLAPILSIKVVDGLDAAIDHINHYSSHHTDAILTNDHVHAQRFLREVDSASVMVNASTRFADGFEYGLGAEIGISTDKFHARGPVGVEGLTSLKFIVLGQGEIRT